MLTVFLPMNANGVLTEYRSFRKLEFSCFSPQDMVYNARYDPFGQTHCKSKSKCLAVALGKNCFRPDSYHYRGDKCQFRENHGRSDRLYLTCPQNTLIRIRKLIYLTLFSLEKIKMKDIFKTKKISKERTSSRECFRQLYVKRNQCFSHDSSQRVKELNKKISGNKAQLQVENRNTKNYCYSNSGYKILAEDIDCNNSLSLYGNGCLADYVKIQYTCEHKADNRSNISVDKLNVSEAFTTRKLSQENGVFQVKLKMHDFIFIFIYVIYLFNNETKVHKISFSIQ